MFFIAGVSGHTGRVVADRLLAAGQSVRVLVRQSAQGDGWRGKGAEVVVGTLEDVPLMSTALSGVQGAFLLLTPDFAAEDFLAAKKAQTHALAEALRAARPSHVVMLSSVAAHLPEGTGPIRAVHHAEQVWREVVPNLTALRPSYFVENWGSALGGLPHGVFPVFNTPDVAFDQIATADIGAVAAELLLAGGAGFQVVEIAGPAHSPNQIAGIVSTLVGKPLAVQAIPDAAMAETLQGWGVSASMAGLYQEMTQGMNAGRLGWEFPDEVRRCNTPPEVVLQGLLAG